MSEFARYIGLPWQAGATGPDAFDCLSFARHIQAVHFGIDMPEISIPDYDDTRALVGLIANHPENRHWRPVATPEHGDLVLIRSPAHYGVWLDIDGGGVLHCVRWCGVVYTHGASWQFSGFGRRVALRHRSKL